MFFADFTKLKIITDYNFTTYNIHFDFDENYTIKQLRDITTSKLNDLNIRASSLPVFYDFYIKVAEDDKVEALEQCARIVTSLVLQLLETGESYQRERRLDVPDKLKPLHASFGCIKRACNNKIKTPIINIRINVDELSYYFCMGRDIDIPEEKEKEENE